MEYLEGGPVVLGEGHDGHSRMSEAIARKFFRDAVQVSLPSLLQRQDRISEEALLGPVHVKLTTILPQDYSCQGFCKHKILSQMERSDVCPKMLEK